MSICGLVSRVVCSFFFQAEDGIRDIGVTGVQTCALPISLPTARIRATVGHEPERAGLDPTGAGRPGRCSEDDQRGRAARADLEPARRYYLPGGGATSAAAACPG